MHFFISNLATQLKSSKIMNSWFFCQLFPQAYPSENVKNCLGMKEKKSAWTKEKQPFC